MPLLSHIQLVFALSFGLRPDLTAPRSGGLPSGARPMVDGVVIGIANQWLPRSGYFGLVIPSHGGRPGVASTWKEWVVHPQKKKGVGGGSFRRLFLHAVAPPPSLLLSANADDPRHEDRRCWLWATAGFPKFDDVLGDG